MPPLLFLFACLVLSCLIPLIVGGQWWGNWGQRWDNGGTMVGQWWDNDGTMVGQWWGKKKKKKGGMVFPKTKKKKKKRGHGFPHTFLHVEMATM